MNIHNLLLQINSNEAIIFNCYVFIIRELKWYIFPMQIMWKFLRAVLDLPISPYLAFIKIFLDTRSVLEDILKRLVNEKVLEIYMPRYDYSFSFFWVNSASLPYKFGNAKVCGMAKGVVSATWRRSAYSLFWNKRDQMMTSIIIYMHTAQTSDTSC